LKCPSALLGPIPGDARAAQHFALRQFRDPAFWVGTVVATLVFIKDGTAQHFDLRQFEDPPFWVGAAVAVLGYSVTLYFIITHPTGQRVERQGLNTAGTFDGGSLGREAGGNVVDDACAYLLQRHLCHWCVGAS